MVVKAEVAGHHIAVARADIDLAPRRAVGDDLHLRAVLVLAERARPLRRRFAQIQHLRAPRVVDVGRAGRHRARAAARRAHVAQVSGGHEARQPAAGDLIPAVALEQHGHARAGFERADAAVGGGRAAPHVHLAAVPRGDRRRRRALDNQRIVHVAGVRRAVHRRADIVPLVGCIQNTDGRSAGHARHHRVIQRRAAPQVDIAAVGIGHRADAPALREGEIVARHVAGLAIHRAHGVPAGSALPLHIHPGAAVVLAEALARAAGILAQVEPAAAHHREIRRQRQRGQREQQRQRRQQFVRFPHFISPTLLSCAYKTNEHAGFFLFFPCFSSFCR